MKDQTLFQGEKITKERKYIHLKTLFYRTTRPISMKLGTKHPWNFLFYDLLGFFTHSIIFHSFRDATITVKDLQLLTCTRSHISASIGTPLNCFVKSRQHGGKPLSIWYINIDVYLSARIYHMSTFCISYLKVVILLQDSIKNVLYPRFSLHLLFQKLHP